MEQKCPLTGLPCSKPKLYQITEVEDNKAKITVSLCEDCFAAYMNQGPLPKKMLEKLPQKANEFVQNLMNFVKKTMASTYNVMTPISHKKPCPNCKATLETISKTGKLGCSQCWDWYYDELKHTLYLAHGTPQSPENLVHKGKRPKNFKPPNDVEENLKMKLVKLRYKLNEAIKKEQYEEAAQLRDIIKELENRVSS